MSPPGRWWWVLALVGCGGAQAGTSTLASRPVVPDRAAVVSGLPIVEMSRPTAGLLRTTLVIDAGSRDADPPALATLSAWVAAADTGASVRVSPDLTEFWTECESAELERCLRVLSNVMARAGDDVLLDRHAQHAARLRATQRSALAQPHRRAVTLALIAAFGDDSLDPLHFEADDDLSVSAVRRFRDDHYGRSRALLSLEGDVPADSGGELESFARGLPSAVQTRQPREVSRQSTGSRAEPASESQAAVAFRFASSSTARGVAEKLAVDGFSPSIFRLRGAAVVVVAAARHRIAELAARSSSVPGTAWARSPVEEWLLEPEPADPHVGIGLGLLCEDGESSEWEAERDALIAEFTRGMNARNTEVEGDVGDGGADVTLSNNARILVRRQPGEVGLVIAFLGGASLDPPAEHGRSAIAADAIAAQCPGTEALIRSDGFGLRMTVPNASAERLGNQVRCAVSAIEDASWRAARGRVRARVATQPARTWAAQALAPGTPGWIAPNGSLAGVGGAQRGPWLDAARSGARTRVAVVGDVDVAATVNAIASALALLAPGESPAMWEAGPAQNGILPAQRDGDRHRVLIGWRGSGGPGAATSAEAFAQAAAGALSAHGVSLAWHDSGASAEDSFAMVAVDVDDEQLEQLADWTREAAEAEADLASAHRRARWAFRAAHAAAEHLALGGDLQVQTPSRSTLQSLRASDALFVIGRAQPAAAFRRHTRAHR